jgi:hypothetical protein
MKLTEQHLRLLIRGILEGRRDFEQATADINYYSDFEDPLFVNPDSKKNIDPARRVKQAWAMAVDMSDQASGSSWAERPGGRWSWIVEERQVGWRPIEVPPQKPTSGSGDDL